MRLESPYLPSSSGAVWLRGNLHTHTTVSDGDADASAAIARYEAAGHDFLAITDHDAWFDPEPHRAASRLTLLSGVEVSASGPHLLAVGTSGTVEPVPDRQRCIEQTNSLGGFAVLNHPNWQTHFNHWDQSALEQLTGYAGIEIYNGVVEFLEGSALALDRWDRLLSAGKRVWGFANDDLHVARQPLLGCNVVQAAGRTPGAVLDALRSGRFYATTGVTIASVSVDGDTLRVEAPDAQLIRFIGMWGHELTRIEAPVAEVRIDEPVGGYVRAECHGAGMRCAWTQPVFKAGG